MAVTITGIGPTALRTFTFPDANAKLLTNAAAVLVSEGGTGAASLTAHGVVIGEGTSAVAVTGVGATGQVLRGVTGADPAFGAVNLTTDVTGTLPVGNGGTGVTAIAAHAVVIGNGAGAVTATSAGTAGQALRSGGASADPSFGEVVQTTTSTGTVNDFALTAGAGVIRCNNASLLTITGITAGFDGQRLVIISIGAGQVDLSHQAAGSTAANRLINFATSGATSLAAGVGTAELEYDTTTARWRLVAHKQGTWIDVTYASGNFTASSAMTWTVDSGDQITYAYLLDARTLKVVAYIDTTTVGGTLHTSLIIAIPGGFTAAKKVQSAAAMFDNGVGSVGYNRVLVSGTTIETGRSDSANWTASTNNTFVRVNIDFPVN